MTSLFRKIKPTNDENMTMFHYNTNTMLDIFTGKYHLGTALNAREKKQIKTLGLQHMLLNGGWFLVNTVAGEPQSFKSTSCLSLLVKTLALYPDIEAIIYDTEGSIQDVDRIEELATGAKFADPLPNNIKNRIQLLDRLTYPTLDDFYLYLRDEVIETKKKHLKDFIIETPFINLKTGKQYRTILPTFVIVDSLSAALSDMEEELNQKHSLSDSEMNRVGIIDSNRKTLFIRQMSNFAARYGIYVIFTGQLNKSVQMNPFEPITREIQYMERGKVVKGTGKRLLFYSLNFFEIRKVASLLDSTRKKAKYPYVNDIPTELSKLAFIVIKCKNNISGSIVPFIASQFYGILPSLTNFDFLSENEFGIEGTSVRKRWLSLLPDITFSRTSIRDKLSESYELDRALQIFSEFYIIKTFWNVAKIPILSKYANMTAAEFTEKLMSSSSIKLSDILNSRGYWTYDPKESRPYLNLFDILQLLDK